MKVIVHYPVSCRIVDVAFVRIFVERLQSCYFVWGFWFVKLKELLWDYTTRTEKNVTSEEFSNTVSELRQQKVILHFIQQDIIKTSSGP